MECSVTLKFGSLEQAMGFLQSLHPSAPIAEVKMQPTLPTASASPLPAAQALDLETVRVAMTKYLEKPGKTAKTAHDIIIKHGAQNLRGATIEQLTAIHAEFVAP